MFSTRRNKWPRWLRSLTSLLGFVAPASAADHHLPSFPPPIPPATAHLAIPPPLPAVAAYCLVEDSAADLSLIAQAPRPFNIERVQAFQFAARLAVVAKLNVASARKPQRRSRPVPPGRRVPMAKTPTAVAHRPARLTVTSLTVRKPLLPAIQSKPTAEVITFQVARTPAQFAFIAKRAA